MQTQCLMCNEGFDASEQGQPCPACGRRMCGLEDLASKFPPYERETAREVARWLNTGPGAIAGGINEFMQGFSSGVGLVVPQRIADEITRSITKLLAFLQTLSCYTVIRDEEALQKRLQESFGEGRTAEVLAKIITAASGKGVLQLASDLGYQAETVSDLRHLNLIEVDKLVSSDMGFFSGSTGLAALEGFFTGLGELALIALDVVAITAINFRYVERIATCFGYDQDLLPEKIVTLRVFAAAFGRDFQSQSPLPAKITAAYELKPLAAAVAKQWTLAQMAEDEHLCAMLTWLKQDAPQQFTKYIISRKAPAAIPIIGAGIGATMNYILTSDTGKAAWSYYRYRKLLEDFGGLDENEMPPARSS
ncbi:MAG: EcsC family protein [Deltaproteobacteria bacterium]|nr:EcsC family protein [Deltaproteobacteria bacterium]